MQTLSKDEIEQVSGGLSPSVAAKITLGLMAFGAASPFVIGAGCAALLAYAVM